MPRSALDDIAAETLAKLIQRWRAGPPVGDWPAYCRAVAAHECVNWLRQRTRSETVTDRMDELPGPQERTQRRRTSAEDEMLRAFSRCRRPAQRDAVLQLHVLQGISLDAMARHLGCRKSNLRRQLRALLREARNYGAA